VNALPEIVATRHESAWSETDIIVPIDCAWFAGHFPHRPILPGVVQIGWAVHFAAALHRRDAPVRALERIKFKRPVLPGARLVLGLTLGPGGHKLHYEYRDAHTSYSSGTLNFGRNK
jgi:3-hydroxymyristoyl/3-hydroxydecanoyl-(acyl carrier protein) dehydratase